MEIFGEEFPRIRIGIGPAPAGQDLANWVLSAFPKGEAETLETEFEKLPEMIREFVMESE